MDEDERLSEGSSAGYAEDEGGEDDGDYGDDTQLSGAGLQEEGYGQGEEAEEAPGAEAEGSYADDASLGPALPDLGALATEEEVEQWADQLGMTPQQVALQIVIASRTAQYHQRADGILSAQMAAEASASPEFFRAYAPRIQANLARVAPEQRGNRKMIQAAAFMAFLEDVPEGKTSAEIAALYARRLGAKAATGGRATPPRPVQAPERRAPSPSTASRAAPAPRRAGAGSDDEIIFGGFARQFGVHPDDARDVRRALRESRR